MLQIKKSVSQLRTAAFRGFDADQSGPVERGVYLLSSLPRRKTMPQNIAQRRMIEANISDLMDMVLREPTIGRRLDFCHLVDEEASRLPKDAFRGNLFDGLLSKCDAHIAQRRWEMEAACSPAQDLSRHQAMLRVLVGIRGALAASRTGTAVSSKRTP